MASRSALAALSLKTMRRALRGRASRPPGERPRRNARRQPPDTREPGATASRARRSASMVGTPSDGKLCETVGFTRRDASRQRDSQHGSHRKPGLGSGNSVLQQHRDRQWADPAGHRRQRARDLSDAGVHISNHDGAASVEVCEPRRSRIEQLRGYRGIGHGGDTDVDDGGPSLDECRRDEPGRPIADTRMSASPPRRRGPASWNGRS